MTRICPLAGPNEAMAHEAQMEAWFAVPRASRPGRQQKQTETGARRVRTQGTFVHRGAINRSSPREAMRLTSPSMEGTKLTGRRSQACILRGRRPAGPGSSRGRPPEHPW
jgi:hypothetical protein